MLKRIAVVLIAAAMLSAAPAAQQPPTPPAPKPEPSGQPVNVRIELTITDQAGPGDPMRKTVTLVVADRGAGSIRNAGSPRGVINVDARPTVLIGGSNTIRLTIGLEYNPRVNATGDQPAREFSSLSEQITVVLESGKPLVISQAADPTSDRRIAVEVRATISK